MIAVELAFRSRQNPGEIFFYCIDFPTDFCPFPIVRSELENNLEIFKGRY